MFEIGASLREARARRKLGYDQVEAETKIRAKYIRCMEDEQFDVLPSGTYVRGFLRTYADYLGLDGQLYVDEYSSRYGDLPDERITRRRERPQQRRNESSNAVLIALAGIVAVGVLLLAAWKLNPSSDRPNAPLPPPVTDDAARPSAANPRAARTRCSSGQQAKKANRATVIITPKVHPVSIRVKATTATGSWLVIRRLSNLKTVVYQNTLTAPDHIGGKMQKDPKGYLITAACNPGSLTLMVNGKPYILSGKGPWRVTTDGRRHDAHARGRPDQRLLSARARPTAALLITGSELLLGLVADRNTSFLARTLDRLGRRPAARARRRRRRGRDRRGPRDAAAPRRPDHVRRPRADARRPHGRGDRAGERARAGAGRAPARDDRRDHGDVRAAARDRRSRVVDGVDKQSLVPRGAHIIDPIGTAPGLVVPWDETTVLVLPGPPSELAQMWPLLERHPAAAVLRAGERLERSLLRIYGVSESVVAKAFDEAGGDAEGTTTTICARRSEVEVLVRAPASARAARERLAEACARGSPRGSSARTSDRSSSSCSTPPVRAA